MNVETNDGTRLFINFTGILRFATEFAARMSEVTDVLYGDIIECKQIIERKRRVNPHTLMFWRRNVTRATFAFIEGVISFLKKAAIDYAKVMGGVLTDDELTFLTAKNQPFVNGKGEVEYGRRAYPKFESDLKFAFKMFAKALGIPVELDVSLDGWRQLRDAVSIRHRVTHPKDVADLDISDDENALVAGGLNWFDQQVARYVESVTEKCVSEMKSIHQQMPDSSIWTADDLRVMSGLLEAAGDNLRATANRKRGGLWAGSETGGALQYLIGATLGREKQQRRRKREGRVKKVATRKRREATGRG